MGLRDLTTLGSWSAAVPAAGDEAALGVRSAGQFHRIHDRYDGPIEVLTPERKRIRLKRVIVKQTAFGPYDD